LDNGLVFVKFGGSLITDKTRPEISRRDVIARLASAVRDALRARPGLSLLLGHGSGSFGHWHASQYGTRQGVHGRDAWVGFARVAASAARLNRIVTDILLDAGIPVLSVRPSASARCRDGALIELNIAPILRALEEQLVPLVHGDVALDEVRGGTIISTEEIMAFLARALQPRRILLVGETEGVLGTTPEGQEANVIPLITPDRIDSVVDSLSGSYGLDVTGGMASKVLQMLQLVQNKPEIAVHILSGHAPGLLTRVLLDPDIRVGTRIMARPSAPREGDVTRE
jgi:isopentenyl phosphate kinase